MNTASRTLTALVLATLITTNPAPAASRQAEGPDPLIAKAEAQAATLTKEQLLDFLSYTSGFQEGIEFQQQYYPLNIQDINFALVWQGMEDAPTGKPSPEFNISDPTAHQLALQDLLIRKQSGTIPPEPGRQSPSDPTLHRAAQQHTARIPDEEILRFISYATGYRYITKNLNESKPIRHSDINRQRFIEGFSTALNSSLPAPYSDPSYILPYAIGIDTLLEQRMAEESKTNQTAGQTFLAANARQKGIIITPSGLQYKIITQGNGPTYDPQRHGHTPLFIAESEGRLINGNIFEKQNGATAHPLQTLPPGLQEALKIMPEGSEWELYIPSQLAFGEDAPASVGRNAVIIVRIHLLSIRQPDNQQPAEPDLPEELLDQLRDQNLLPAPDADPEPANNAPQPPESA